MSRSAPEPGQLYRHVESGTIAQFRGWRDRPASLGGPLMVLSNPQFGECRWHPCRARLYVAPQKQAPGPKPTSTARRTHT